MFILKIVFALILVFSYLLIGAIYYKFNELDTDEYGIALLFILLWPILIITVLCMNILEFFNYKFIRFYLYIAEKIIVSFGGSKWLIKK